jgi:fucose permease
VASRAETTVVDVAGAAQGIVLVTFPAAGTVLIDPARYALSGSQYGLLFLPQVLAAIVASLVGSRLVTQLGVKTVYLGGLVASLVSMTLLLASAPIATSAAAYPTLLLATASLGVGFGLTVPALNTMAAAFHPASPDASVLTLNALLGLGTVLAPILVAIFVAAGTWWGLPLTSILGLSIVIAVSLRLPLRTGTRSASRATTRLSVPRRFWLFATFALLYGVCETINGNWLQLDMTGDLGATVTQAALALTAFWTMVTLGRVASAWARNVLSPGIVYRGLPFVLAGAFVLISRLPEGSPIAAIASFGLAGLGCSALLPLTISFGQEEFVARSATVAGGVIAAYQLGYGLAAFGTGALVSNGVALSTLYGWAVLIALALGIVAVPIRRRTPR